MNPPMPSKGPGRPPRGFLDLLLAAAMVYAVYAETSCGTLPVYAYRTWQNQPTPDLLASFRGRETAVRIPTQGLENVLTGNVAIPANLETIARQYQLDEDLLIAHLVATQAACGADDCQIPTPPFLGRSLDSYALPDKVSLRDLGQGLYVEKSHFEAKGWPAPNAMALALESLFVGRATLERAISQAQVSGAASPDFVEHHAPFLSPSLRRSELQNAMQILAHQRLRTLAWPADPGWRISSPYGDRIHPVLGTQRFHNGTDIAAPQGTPLFAAHRGVITRTGEDSVSGRFVDLHVGFEIQATYCHLDQVRTREGQAVERKEPIATVGSTGRVTGPHLHYILRINGKTVDPQAYGDAPRRSKGVP